MEDSEREKFEIELFEEKFIGCEIKISQETAGLFLKEIERVQKKM